MDRGCCDRGTHGLKHEPDRIEWTGAVAAGACGLKHEPDRIELTGAAVAGRPRLKHEPDRIELAGAAATGSAAAGIQRVADPRHTEKHEKLSGDNEDTI